VDRVREELGEEPVDQGAAPSGRLEQQERADQVRDALARISEEHRAILILREVDGCAYEEIAEALDLPVGTIRSRLHRARMQLREQLKDLMQEDVK
jgi:RNA polymerase sigma-70 factor (ECF subfamily)